MRTLPTTPLIVRASVTIYAGSATCIHWATLVTIKYQMFMHTCINVARTSRRTLSYVHDRFTFT